MCASWPSPHQGDGSGGVARGDQVRLSCPSAAGTMVAEHTLTSSAALTLPPGIRRAVTLQDRGMSDGPADWHLGSRLLRVGPATALSADAVLMLPSPVMSPRGGKRPGRIQQAPRNTSAATVPPGCSDRTAARTPPSPEKRHMKPARSGGIRGSPAATPRTPPTSPRATGSSSPAPSSPTPGRTRPPATPATPTASSPSRSASLSPSPASPGSSATPSPTPPRTSNPPADRGGRRHPGLRVATPASEVVAGRAGLLLALHSLGVHGV